MPISRQRLVAVTFLLLALGLLALATIVVANVWLVQRTQGFITDVTHLRQLRAASVDFRALLQDAETSQRGYLLTGEDGYLQPLMQSQTKLDSQIQRLAGVAEYDAFAKQQLPGLLATARQKMAELTNTVELFRQGRREQALAVVRSDLGKNLMDQARQTLQAIVTQVETRLVALEEERAQTTNALWWVSVVGGLVIIVVTAGGMVTIVSYLRELATTRREIETLNASLEERVRERTSELARANEEIQRFAYIVTHDLRAPLVNIMGFTSELEQNVTTLQGFVENLGGDEDDPDFQAARVAAKEELPEALAFIRSSTRKMDGLINAILKLSREGRRELKLERIDLGALLKSATASVQHQVSEADGTIDLDIKVPNLYADRLSLEQIIGNLLDNAVKYRRRDVPLKITVKAVPQPGGLVDISVADNGRGIESQDLERVFELFRRSGQQTQPGEGIGLAHVRAMARNLGGDVLLNSTFGEGSVFTLRVPAVARAMTRSMAA